MPLVLQFLEGRIGDGAVAKLLSSVPALAGLAGGSGQGGSSPLGGLGGLFK